jgi:hypothetical protein
MFSLNIVSTFHVPEYIFIHIMFKLFLREIVLDLLEKLASLVQRAPVDPLSSFS